MTHTMNKRTFPRRNVPAKEESNLRSYSMVVCAVLAIVIAVFAVSWSRLASAKDNLRKNEARHAAATDRRTRAIGRRTDRIIKEADDAEAEIDRRAKARLEELDSIDRANQAQYELDMARMEADYLKLKRERQNMTREEYLRALDEFHKKYNTRNRRQP